MLNFLLGGMMSIKAKVRIISPFRTSVFNNKVSFFINVIYSCIHRNDFYYVSNNVILLRKNNLMTVFRSVKRVSQKDVEYMDLNKLYWRIE
jgi:hypothetical protein